MKKYIWGFPGIGKSSLNIPGLKVVDADCRQFEFINVGNDDLHGVSGNKQFVRDEKYPQNYLDYINNVDADVVLINCHPNLLDGFDKDNVLLVYPAHQLLSEYLQRYVDRGDDTSFVSYMAAEAPGMIDFLDSLDYKKYQILDSGVYLSDLFERNDFKMKVITRKELTEHVQRAMDLGVLSVDYENNAVIFGFNFADFSNDEIYKLGAETLAHLVLDGRYELDIDRLIEVCNEKEKQIQQEKILLERRGGLSREELEDKIMQGIVNGALKIRHGQIAPYSYGFEVEFFGGGAGESGKNRWECYCDFFEVPKMVAQKIEQNSQDSAVFSNQELPPINIEAFLAAIESAENNKISTFTPEKNSTLKRAKNSYTYPYRNTVAGIGDVHKGNGLDGIAKGAFGGDYSSMTTSSQNDLVQTLVFMKGFCLDCMEYLHSRPGKENVISYLMKHGTDVSTPEKLQAWIKANPEKCGKEENRLIFGLRDEKPSLSSQIEASASLTGGKTFGKAVEIDRGEER